MHVWIPGAQVDGLPLLNSEYGGGEFDAAKRGWHLRWQTQELRRHDRLAGYVYTELCDVEHELAGIYDEQRRRQAARLRPGAGQRRDDPRDRRRSAAPGLRRRDRRAGRALRARALAPRP